MIRYNVVGIIHMPRAVQRRQIVLKTQVSGEIKKLDESIKGVLVL